eukprot:12384753-Prorocentrum_lima.AAC.1
MVESHHAILRSTYLKCKAQAEDKGLKFDPPQLLTQAVVAKDCLTNVGGFSPIQATLGYQPALLPNPGQGDAYCDDNSD